MENVNSELHFNPQRLNMPLRTIFGRQLHSLTIDGHSTPSDVSGVYIRIFNLTGGHYDIPGNTDGEGTTRFDVPATCLPTCGNCRYEVHGTGPNENPVALGEGALVVQSFTPTTDPVAPGTIVPIMEIPDDSGAMHRIVAVQRDGEWTSQLRSLQN